MLLDRVNMKKNILIIEIKKLKNEFNDQQKRLKPKHLITRRIGSFHLFLFITMLLITVCIDIKLAVVNLKVEHQIPTFVSLLVWLGCVISVWFTIKCKVLGSSIDKKKRLETFLLFFNVSLLPLYIFVLVTYETMDMAVLLSGFCLVIYLGCYFANKQHGYTRGWARNQTYYFLLKSLEWEVEQLEEATNIYSELKFEELTLKFTRIIETQLRERQRDIIGDYLSTNNATFSWINSIKK